jgi:NCAIR mutase (PurE)-related protein
MTDRSADEVLFDFDRRRRTGLDETVFAQGKSTAQLDVIFTGARSRGASLLVTRLDPDKYDAVAGRWAQSLDYCPISRTAYFDWQPTERSAARVAIVAGGTSDAAVAREAERTLEFNGAGATLFVDVGVAGLWRLTRHIDAIGQFPVVIAVAGMDAALPTVIGGLIPALIVAVPTSVGYGVAAGGHAALHALLASCAPGITVVNIDNGYGAACAALRALRMDSTAPGRAFA